MRHQRLLELENQSLFNYDKEAQKLFHHASKVDKGKLKPKTEESIAKRVKLENERIFEIKKEEKNINNELFKHYFINYQKPSDMYEKLCKIKDKINEDQVDLIKKILDKVKKEIKTMPKNKKKCD